MVATATVASNANFSISHMYRRFEQRGRRDEASDHLDSDYSGRGHQNGGFDRQQGGNNGQQHRSAPPSRPPTTAVGDEAAAAAVPTPEAGSNKANSQQIRVLNNKNEEVPEAKRYPTFAEYPNSPEWLLEGTKRMGFKGATDIQAVTMPLLQEGHDVIGLAPTGSGKTVGFAYPALANFRRNQSGNPAILVLAPVRELVQQTARVFRQLGGDGLYVCEAYGGESRLNQSHRISQGCDVLVACPGRLKDFCNSNIVNLSEVSFFVLDEADRLLDMGFKQQLDEIMSFMDPNRKRQSMMWSATWPREVQHLAREFMAEERLMVKAGTAGEGQQINLNIKQEVFMTSTRGDKVHRMEQIFDEERFRDAGKVIIFVERQMDCDSVAEMLVHRVGVNPNHIAALHGGMHQQYRDQIMGAFKNNRMRFLVATDVASRGLDFPDITAVINYDAPKNLDQYCHRIGRTGRAGRKGKAFTFVENRPSPLCGPLGEYLAKCSMSVPRELKPLGEQFQVMADRKAMRYGRRDGGGRGYNSRGGGGFDDEDEGYSRNRSSNFHSSSNNANFRSSNASQRRDDDAWGSGGGSW